MKNSQNREIIYMEKIVLRLMQLIISGIKFIPNIFQLYNKIIYETKCLQD
jgi:hypothetical protein